MPFSDPTPVVEMLPGQQFRVQEAFAYTLSEETKGVPKGTVVDVPKGLMTDLASVPRLLWSFLPPDGNYAPAAIVHDRIYRASGHVVGGWTYTRAQADAVLEQAMLSLGTVSDGECWAIYWGVRLFGWWRWRR